MLEYCDKLGKQQESPLHVMCSRVIYVINWGAELISIWYEKVGAIVAATTLYHRVKV